MPPVVLRAFFGVISLAGVGGGSFLRADVTLAPLFTDHAVLQRDKPVPVWGLAKPGEHVSVRFQEQTVGATADTNGRWLVYLDALPTNAAGSDLVVAGANTITVHDVVVGEVWLASGQSNMEFPVRTSTNAEPEIKAANFPLLRCVRVKRTVADKPADTVVTSGWQAATPESVPELTAVGYYFARELVRKLDVPVGLIQATWGGTRIEAWMSNDMLLISSSYDAVHARWEKEKVEYPERAKRFPAERAAWEKAEAEAQATHRKNTVRWPGPPIGPGTPNALSGLYNGMIAPVQPWALRGFIWYQGESNWPHANEYTSLFETMIKGWRSNWGREDLPFFFVQLPVYREPTDPSGEGWAWLREAQARALSVPGTGMVVGLDQGDPRQLHPPAKQELGRRLALLAKMNVYGGNGDANGPMFAGASREKNTLRVHFTHAANGLVAHDRPVQSLEVAGADRKFHPATGKIERDTLVVSSPLVKEPVAVRYAWSDAPVANLFNGAGLPAAPFRSDNW